MSYTIFFKNFINHHNLVSDVGDLKVLESASTSIINRLNKVFYSCNSTINNIFSNNTDREMMDNGSESGLHGKDLYDSCNVGQNLPDSNQRSTFKLVEGYIKDNPNATLNSLKHPGFYPKDLSNETLVTTSSVSSTVSQTVSSGYIIPDSPEMPLDNLLNDLRSWRRDASQFQLFESAILWAKEVLLLSKSLVDAYELAEIYFLAGHFHLALQTLMNHDILKTNMLGQMLAARCYISLDDLSNAAETIGEDIQLFDNANAGDSKSQSFQVQAINWFLRGKIFFLLEKPDFAKKCFLKALAVDLHCYEALHWLRKNQMLSLDEEMSISGNPEDSLTLKRKFIEVQQGGDSLDSPAKTKKINNAFGNPNSPSTFSTHILSSPQKIPRSKKDHGIGNGFAQSSEHNSGYSVSSEVIEDSHNSDYYDRTDFIKTVYMFSLEHNIHSDEMKLKQISLTKRRAATFQKAKSLFCQFDYDGSYNLIEPLYKQDPTNSEWISLFLKVLFKLQKRSKLLLLAKNLRDVPNKKDVYLYASGLFFQLDGQKEVARSKFLSCCKKYPEFAPAWMSYGSLCPDSASAIKVFLNATRLQPDRYEPCLKLGHHYRKLGFFSLAMDQLNRSSALSNHQQPCIENEKGLVKLSMGDLEVARSFFEKGLNGIADQEFYKYKCIRERLWVNLGYCYFKEGNLSDAQLCFNKACNLNPQSIKALKALSKVNELLGQ